MLDHLFLDAVAVLRSALDASLLEHAGQEDRMVYDLLNGDLVWEASVSLPGDSDPPRVSADLNLDWPSWSQAAWRAVLAGESVEDPPEVGVELVFRVQRLASRPDLAQVLQVLPEESPELGAEHLARSAPVLEEAVRQDPGPSELAVEVAYEGTYRVPLPVSDEAVDEHGTVLPGWVPQRAGGGDALARASATRQVSAAVEATLTSMASWVASALVRLADLDLDYLPGTEED
jgi:hypothetical protein